MSFFELKYDQHIALLTFNRPPVNALSSAVLQELNEQVDKIRENKGIRVLIITSLGTKFFAAGADIKEIQGADRSEGLKINSLFQNTFQNVHSLPIPVICAVNGLAIGGGSELALACDIRIASTNAAFSLPEASLGLIPGGGGTQRLPRLIPLGKAKELLYTGSRLKAEEALQWGLVEHVVSPEELIPFSKKIAEQIASKAPIAIKMIKESVDKGISHDIEQGLQIELAASGNCFDSADFHEGFNAFLEKEKLNLAINNLSKQVIKR